MTLKLIWNKPEGGTPNNRIEFNAYTEIHLLKIWLDTNNDWHGSISNLNTNERRLPVINTDLEKEAMYQVEQFCFAHEKRLLNLQKQASEY